MGVGATKGWEHFGVWKDGVWAEGENSSRCVENRSYCRDCVGGERWGDGLYIVGF